jgi:hypothetical protein
VIWHFQVGVPDSDYESAREILGLNAEDDEVKDQPVEIKESIGPVSQSVQLNEEKKAKSYREPWDPNEATEKIWSQDPSDSSSVVELSLKENFIRYRIQSEENGRRKFLVAPRDKPRAREILRQIESGEPPS